MKTTTVVAFSPEQAMNYPISTGQAARLLGVSEPRLNGLIRKGKLDPQPLVSAGRRHWQPRHLLQAAEVLGVLTDDLRRRLGEEVTHAS